MSGGSSLTSVLDSQIFNMGLVFGAMQLTKGIDFTTSGNLLYTRLIYCTVQLVVMGLSYYLIHLIQKKNDTTPLRYVEPPKPGSKDDNSEGKLVSTTNAKYDVAEVKKAINTTLTGIAIIAVLHLQFKLTQPLIIQTILSLKNFLHSKEALIHFWGQKAEGDLQRPFKVPNPFGSLVDVGQPKTDEESIKKAEKAQKSSKDE